MAVVTKYGTGYKDPAAVKAIDGVYAEARMRALASKISIANGDSATSKLYFGQVPSNAIVDPSSTLYHGAVTGLTDFDLGFEQGRTVISAGASQCLMDAQTLATAGTKSAVQNVTTGNLTKRAWELAGFTNDPGGYLDVVGVMNAAATAAADVELFLRFLKA